MRIPFRLPIAVKLGTVSVGLLLAGMIPAAIQTSSDFEKETVNREKDSSAEQASARASEVGVILDSVISKISFFGPLLLKETVGQKSANKKKAKNKKAAAKNSKDKKAKSDNQGSFVKQSFATDNNYIALRIFKSEKGKTSLVRKIFNDTSLGGYELDASYLDRVDKEHEFPILEVFDGQIVGANRSMPGGAPVLSIGMPLVKDNLGRVTHVALADLNLNVIQKGFAAKGARTTYLIDGRGRVYAHPEESFVMERRDLTDLAVVKKAAGSKLSRGQLTYWNDGFKDNSIASFAKSRLGLTVISEISEGVLLEPARKVRRGILRFMFYVLSGAIFVAFLFSLSITRPVQRLVEVTKRIAKGEFDFSVSQLVTTNDEVGTLAVSFDAMLDGLRERDKVKNLFNKFHGTSVTENLLESDEVTMGGDRKKVVVFFSDIRGFTALSESMTAEDVVNMVNEYFDVMVGIILKNHGVVDKFIGDAIMAIWGAPTGSDRDPFNAVTACLEMRKALVDLNNKRVGRGEQALRIGIGLHMGDAVSGNIGSEERMEFTVIGDTVNTAARIEESTKAQGTDLVITQTVADAVKDEFVLVEGGGIKAKGVSDVIRTFKVAGYIRADGTEEIIRTEFSEYEAEKAGKAEVV